MVQIIAKHIRACYPVLLATIKSYMYSMLIFHEEKMISLFAEGLGGGEEEEEEGGEGGEGGEKREEDEEHLEGLTFLSTFVFFFFFDLVMIFFSGY